MIKTRFIVVDNNEFFDLIHARSYANVTECKNNEHFHVTLLFNLDWSMKWF